MANGSDQDREMLAVWQKTKAADDLRAMDFPDDDSSDDGEIMERHLENPDDL
jgi:hypothetical protein